MNITIYTTPTCGFCHMVKEYLNDKKIEFSEKDISQDQEAYKEILEKTNQLGVPVTQINDTYIIGFDREKIDLALATAA